MFGKKFALKKKADEIGPLLHAQLVKYFQESGELNWTPKSVAFTSGYIGGFVLDSMTRRGLNNQEHIPAIVKHVCNGVLPKQLWKAYSSGLSSYELAKTMKSERSARILIAYESGLNSGIEDAENMDYENSSPSRWAEYLTQEMGG